MVSFSLFLFVCFMFCQLYKKTPAVISTMEAPPTPLADVGAILTTLTEGQTEIGAHNKIGVSPVISDPSTASSFR